MKDLLEWLSLEQKKELEDLVEKVVKTFKPEQVYCFGFRINSSVKCGCFSEGIVRNAIDYDLLVVTQPVVKSEIEIQKFTGQSFKSGSLTIINFSQKVVLAALSVGQNFVNTIIKSGLLLYTRENEPYKSEIIAERAVHINRAKISFERSFETAFGFIDAAADRFINEDYSLMAFMLHQAMAVACRGFINLFLGFNGNKKNLETLFALANNVAGHLPPFLQYEQNNELIKQLLKSYNGVKCNRKFVPEKDIVTNHQGLTETLIETMEDYGKQHLNKLMSG